MSKMECLIVKYSLALTPPTVAEGIEKECSKLKRRK